MSVHFSPCVENVAESQMQIQLQHVVYSTATHLHDGTFLPTSHMQALFDCMQSSKNLITPETQSFYKKVLTQMSEKRLSPSLPGCIIHPSRQPLSRSVIATVCSLVTSMHETTFETLNPGRAVASRNSASPVPWLLCLVDSLWRDVHACRCFKPESTGWT